MVEDKEKYIKDLDRILIFRVLSREEKVHLLNLSDIHKFSAKDYVISEGSVQSHMFAVIKGTVHVIVQETSGKEVFICSIGQGDVFGEAGIFLKVKRTANVVCSEDTVLLRLDRKNMRTFIKQHKDAGIKILMLIIYSLLKKLRDANQELAFERKSDVDQEDVDSIIQDFVNND